MELTWTIPNLEPYVLYALKEIARWTAENAFTITVILVILNWADRQALKLEAVKDNTKLAMVGYYLDKFLKFMIHVVKGEWLTRFRTGGTAGQQKRE